MMGFIWIILLILSLLAGIGSHRLPELTPAAWEGGKQAVEICLSLAGSLCLWSGVAKLMERSGITDFLGKLLRPLLGRLFPSCAEDSLALGHLTANVSANLLGLGNAATPMGIAAVKRMQALHGGSEASDEMCRLIVLNTASIQLLPTTVASLRSACGSVAPFAILPGVWISSLCSVCMGLLAAELLRRFYA